MNKQKYSHEGFTMVVLLMSLVLVILLSLYTYSQTMKRVQKSVEEEVPGVDVPAPTLQNYQQTLDGVKENLDQNVEKEQQRIDEAQKAME